MNSANEKEKRGFLEDLHEQETQRSKGEMDKPLKNDFMSQDLKNNIFKKEKKELNYDWHTLSQEIYNFTLKLEKNVIYESKLIKGITNNLEEEECRKFEELEHFKSFLIGVEKEFGIRTLYVLKNCEQYLKSLQKFISEITQFIEKSVIYSIVFNTQRDIISELQTLLGGFKWLQNRLYPTKDAIGINSKAELKRILDSIRFYSSSLSHVFSSRDQNEINFESLIRIIHKFDPRDKSVLFESSIDPNEFIIYMSETLKSSLLDLLIQDLFTQDDESIEKSKIPEAIIEIFDRSSEKIREKILNGILSLKLSVKEIKGFKNLFEEI